MEILFNKFAGLYAGNFITKRLRDRCFPVNMAIFLKTSILKGIYERPFLNSQGGRSDRNNRDVSRDDNKRRIQTPVKHQR